MEVNLLYPKDNYEYFVFSLTVPEKKAQLVLEQLQDPNLIPTPYIRLFDVEQGDEDQKRISCKVRSGCEILGQVISHLIRIEMEAWGKKI